MILLTKKKLLFITGTRADFSKLSTLISAVDSSKYEKLIFTTGMHMLEKYGLTKLEVQKISDAEHVDFVNQRPEDTLDTILTKTITGLSDYIVEAKPDIVIFHGDRIESLAAALACSTNYVTSIHVEGGELSGTIDEVFRHAITKLSDFHLVCCDEAEERIIQLGENPRRIFNIGSPELDFHSKDSGVLIDEVKDYYEIPYINYGICIFHPITTEYNTIKSQAENFFNQVIETDKNFVVIEPNNDMGCNEIRNVISNLPKERFRILPSMRFNYFSELMKNCKIFIGNSSVGVREAPFMGLASVNVGTRQDRRSNHKSITNLPEINESNLTNIIIREWGKRYESCKKFWAGGSANAFKEFIKNQNLDKQIKQKRFYDLKSDI